MSEFNDKRTALNNKRSEHDAARLSLLATTEKIRLLERSRSNLARKSNPENTANKKELAALDSKINNLKSEEVGKRNVLDGLTADVKGQLEIFKVLTDPRVQLNKHFTNSTPFLLLPTRLETRFKTVSNPDTGQQQEQLWVRIYPDTCMVDSFDPQLSDQELRNAARFWADFYAAGDIIDPSNPDPVTLELQKAAWAFIAKLEGAGRAAWIVKSKEAEPQPGSIFPKRTSDKTIILTIATEDTAILADQPTIFNFFKDLWLADKNEEKIDLVRQSVPNPDELIEKYIPVNFYEDLPLGLKKEEADLQIALVLLPDSLEATGKTNSWSQAAHVSVAPERFMLLGYKNDKLEIEELGNLVASPLQVGFDPNNSEENNFTPTESGDLEIPEEVKWIVDFDEAVNMGMGFRINLNDTTRNGLDRLFVLGVRLSADESTSEAETEDNYGGQHLITELFEHHFYSPKGFSIISQGTPTNNSK